MSRRSCPRTVTIASEAWRCAPSSIIWASRRRSSPPKKPRILSIPRGSLTKEEFKQIQSHVVHTFQFLSQIPWTRELRRIPEIARSHHEKLDGSGYPLGRRSSEIALETRMMTIADIFDALTATDRPYKAAVPVEAALDILGHEAQVGGARSDLLEMFIARGAPVGASARDALNSAVAGARSSLHAARSAASSPTTQPRPA